MGDLTALCLQGEYGIPTILFAGMISVFSFFSLSLRVSIRLSSCVLCFSWSDTLVFGVKLTHLSSPPSLPLRMTRFLTRQISHTTIHLSTPVLPGPIEFEVSLACASARSVPLVVFLCDRRIAFSCSGYSTMACLDQIYVNGDLCKMTQCD